MKIKITFSDGETGVALEEDELNNEEVKVLLTDIELAEYKHPLTGKITKGIAGWCANAIYNKARQCMDDIVEHSGRGSRHTDVLKKYQIIGDLIVENHELLKSAKVKQAEIDASIPK